MFQIRSRPDTYQTGTTSDGRLVVVGPFRHPWVIAVIFDRQGTFLGVERRAVQAATKQVWDEGFFQECLDRIIASWKADNGFIEGPIRVKPFFLSEYCIGIEEFPLDLSDYLSNPSKYSLEDQMEFARDVERWKSEGNFVFYWSESYHLDKDGDSL
jgi:hypothetical protein